MNYLRKYLNEIDREARVNKERDERLSDLQEKEREVYEEGVAAKAQGFLIDASELSGFNVEVRGEQPPSLANEKRGNQLHFLIWRVYQALLVEGKRATAHDVWNELKRNGKAYDKDEIIDEVTTGEILWTSMYRNGQRFKKSSLDAMLSRLKKKPPF